MIDMLGSVIIVFAVSGFSFIIAKIIDEYMTYRNLQRRLKKEREE